MLNKITHSAIFTFILFASCSKSTLSPELESETSEGLHSILQNLSTPQLDSMVPLDTMSLGSSSFSLAQAGLSAVLKAEYETILYRAYYQTTHYNGQSTQVSGLVSIPVGATPSKVISLQSGTNSNRDNSPSAPDLSSYPYSAAFAATGHIFVASDFIGLGQSYETPTYAHMESTSHAAQDLIDIALDIQALLSEEEAKLYLIGLSSGAAANVYLQAQLETDQDKYPLEQSANVSGPYQISQIQSEFALENDNNYFLGYLANSYAEVYDIKLADLVEADYVDTLPFLYSGGVTRTEIQAALPLTSAELIRPEIFQSIQNQDESEFMKALRDNDVYNTKLREPMSLYYSTADLTVDPQDSEKTFEVMKAMDNPVSLINLGEFDHLTGIVNSFPLIAEQFEL